MSPENDRVHRITFARSTHKSSAKMPPLQHVSPTKGAELR